MLCFRLIVPQNAPETKPVRLMYHDKRMKPHKHQNPQAVCI